MDRIVPPQGGVDRVRIAIKIRRQAREIEIPREIEVLRGIGLAWIDDAPGLA